MPTHADVRRCALSLPEACEAPHFEATSFRVNKKIFCTMGENGAGIVLKLAPEDQHNLAADDSQAIKPVAAIGAAAAGPTSRSPEWPKSGSTTCCGCRGRLLHPSGC